MLSFPADDARTVAIVTAIQSGDVETLQRHLRDSAELATARAAAGHTADGHADSRSTQPE